MSGGQLLLLCEDPDAPALEALAESVMSRWPQYMAYFDPVTLLSAIAAMTQHIGLVATAALTFSFGPIGAAIAISGTVIAWVSLGAVSLVGHIDIDPTLVGLVRELRTSR